MEESSNLLAELHSLVGVFFSETEELAEFRLVAADEMSEPFPSLLNHDMHMTVTVEKFHSSLVDVEVLEHKRENNFYSREILLRRQSDSAVVQYGIVRLNFDFLSDEVVAEIEAQKTPLGRVLISHDVMRRVKLLSLYEVTPGGRMLELMGLAPGQSCYGRTALIYCDNKPAIELLEVVCV